MFVKLTNGTLVTYTLGQLRRDNPNTSFPKHISDETLAEYGVFSVTETDAPKVDSKTHRVISEVQSVNGVWTQVWNTIPLDADKAGENVRAHRDRLLSETDWVVVMHTEKGTNIPLEWETYRQALRDITSHVNFPYLAEEDWPTKP